jgi:ATP-binding cassette subfamily F protein uup
MELVVPPPPQLGNRIVELDQVGIQLGDRRLFDDLSLSFAPGMRLGVVGRNGLGKTTLLRIILGELEPTAGEVRLGQLTQFNYVDQGRLQLREDRTVLEEMGDGPEWVQWGEDRISLRGYLKRFLFTDDRLTTQVRYLSGGERSRLLLARILKKGGNFLILDEPTNDLDLSTLRVLEEALVAFPGCVLVVSHDRYFLNRVCTGILGFEGEGMLQYHLGSYDDYLAAARTRSNTEGRTSPAAANQTAHSAKADSRESGPKKQKLSYKEQRELDSMEEAILKAEQEVERLETLFGSPDFHRLHAEQTPALLKELVTAKQRVAQLYTRWEILNART